METANAKLVTVVLPFGAADRLMNDLKDLGASGFTTVQANGFGRSGTRTFGLIEGANVRVESIVDDTLCRRILEHLEMHYAHTDLVAHVHDVEAIPREHFAPRAG